MATAATAAPAAAAPAPAPSAPAPSTSATAGGSQPTPGTATQDAAPARKPLAPIKAKPAKAPSLPGVFPDGDPFPAPPGGETSDAGSAQTGPVPARGPDGRFVAGAPPAAPAGEHAPERQPAEAKPTPFEFAGEKFASKAEAEQNLKSLRGQFKPLQALARSIGGIDKVVGHVVAAAESARSWKARADQLEAELSAARSGAQPAAAQSQTQDATQAEPVKGVDWELYAEVKRLATEAGEPWKAEQWLHEQTEKVIDARLQRKLDERFAPLDQQQEQAAVVAQTETLFESMAGYANADGSPAFPELADPQAAYEIGRLWRKLGLPAESALTPQGAMAAVGLYRLARGTSQAKPAVGATPPPSPTPPPPAQLTDAQGAAALADGKPVVVSAPSNGQSAEAARILAGLRQASVGSRAQLGFDA